jgi:hypothetical protein
MAACRRRVLFLFLSTLVVGTICAAKLPNGDVLSSYGSKRQRRANIPVKNDDAGAGEGFRDNTGGEGLHLPQGVPLQDNQGRLPVQNKFPPLGNNLNVPSGGLNKQGVQPGPLPPENLGKSGAEAPRASKKKISDSVECAKDVQRFCSKGVKDNNFSILDCLQSDERVSLRG